jgi:hypothetical protein
VVAALLGEAPPPTADDHVVLHRLHKRAHAHMVTLWRLAYDIPANDPRTLAVTEYDAACDLLERAYHRNRFRADRPDLRIDATMEELDEMLDEVVEAYEDSGLKRHLVAELDRRDNPQTATIRSIRMKPRSEP